MADAQYSAADYTNLFKNDQFNQLDINDQLSKLSSVEPAFRGWDADKYASFRKSLGVPLQGQIRAPTSFKDKAIEFARPLVAPAVGAIASTAAAPTGPLGMGIVGVGASALVDQALQAAEDRKPVSPLFGQTGIGNTAEMLATNEIGGRIGDKVIGKIGAVLSEMGTPGSITGSISKLQPTFSQMYQNTFGKGTVSKWVEDIFASGSKAASIENSGKLGLFEGTALAGGIAGRRPGVVSNPVRMAQNMAVGAENNLAASYAESDGLANTAKLIAKANPQQIAQGVSVDGPVRLNNTILAAKSFLDERTKLLGDLTKAPPEDQQLIAAAQRILSVAQPTIDPQSGQIIRSMPISFEDAWNFKKGADRFAYGDPSESTSFTQSTFRSISKALNQDIDTSIPLWQNNPNGAATKAWQNAKATVAQRLQTFGEDGVKQLINTTNSPVPAVDAILQDPVKLQRALNAGELKMPSGTIASSNMKKDLQGYKLMTMLQDAWKGDPIDPTKGAIQSEKFNAAWNDPGFSEGKKILFTSQNRADIDQLFKEIAITQQKQSFSGFGSKNLTMIRGGLMLAPSLVTGALTGISDYTMGIAGVTIGGTALGHLLTKNTTMGLPVPRMMIALAAGQPIGRSMEAASRAIVGALQGTGALITINTNDGKKIVGTIDKDGRFTPSQP